MNRETTISRYWTIYVFLKVRTKTSMLESRIITLFFCKFCSSMLWSHLADFLAQARKNNKSSPPKNLLYFNKWNFLATRLKNILIFREMKLSSRKIKKVLIFSQKVFLTFQEVTFQDR